MTEAPAHADELALDEPRARKIVAVALRLAEQGGFEAVRLRDVAQGAGVALRTLYKRFAGKDELLFAVMVGELIALEDQLEARPVAGASAIERVRDLFEVITGAITGRPKLGRAILRALTSSTTNLPRRVAGFHGRIDALIAAAIRGDQESQSARHDPRIGTALQHVWFSALIGWSTGLHDAEDIVPIVTDAAALMLERS